MSMIRILIIASMAVGGHVAHAETEGALPAAFLGNWSQSCDAWGTPATCTTRWSAGKHSSHLIQDYAIHRLSDGAQIFAGRGVYRIDGDAVHGAWEGSNGAIHPITGKFEGDALRVVWGTPETEIGRSEYVLENGMLTVTDSVLAPQGWRAFMTVSYARADESPCACAELSRICTKPC